MNPPLLEAPRPYSTWGKSGWDVTTPSKGSCVQPVPTMLVSKNPYTARVWGAPASRWAQTAGKSGVSAISTSRQPIRPNSSQSSSAQSRTPTSPSLTLGWAM